MDRETIQRLLKESIVFLCRTYVGVVSDFEVDCLICVSRDDGSSEQHVVFKIHELVTKGEDVDETLANFSGSGLDCRKNGTVSKRRPGSRKRKFNQFASSSSFNCGKKIDSLATCTDSIPGFPEFKLEAPWSEDLLKSADQLDHTEAGKAVKKPTSAAIKDDAQSRYSCNCCRVYFETKKNLDQHMLSAHQLSTCGFCELCEIAFIETTDFEDHNRLVHPIRRSDVNDVPMENCDATEYGTDQTEAADNINEDLERDEVGEIISSIAMFPITTKYQEVRSRKSSGFNQISTEALVLDSVGLFNDADIINSVLNYDRPDVEGVIVDQQAPRECIMCNLQFVDFPAFNIHCKEAHDIFACPYCTKTFSQQSARDSHLFKHTGEKPYECPDCMVNFSRLDSLRRHRAKAHGLSWADLVIPEADSFQPDSFAVDDLDAENFAGIHSSQHNDCVDGSIDLSDKLLELSRSHPGSCQSSDAIEISDEDSCGRSGRGRYRNITTFDPDRTFVCEICRETVQGTSAFRDHCDTFHRRVPCPYCGGTFTQKASMERHQRQHTGERPYKCKFCEHSYTRKENLQTHVLRMHRHNAELS